MKVQMDYRQLIRDIETDDSLFVRQVAAGREITITIVLNPYEELITSDFTPKANGGVFEGLTAAPQFLLVDPSPEKYGKNVRVWHVNCLPDKLMEALRRPLANTTVRVPKEQKPEPPEPPGPKRLVLLP